MSNNHQLPLSVQPIISYPHEAQVGKTYLMTIDLQTCTDDWPYEDEEYPIYCMLETLPLFSSKPVGAPAVVLHRFGGSYGAAQFLLTAAQEEMEGEIKVTLVNGWGVPVRALKLTQIKLKLMDVEAALKFVESAVFATTQRYLKDGEATVIQGTWEGKTYGESVNEQQINKYDPPSVIPQDFLQSVARKQGVSDTELEALSLAMEGQTTPAIARQLAISEDAVRKRLSEVYQKFRISGRGPVKLAQLQQLLVSQYQAQQQTANPSPLPPISDTPHHNWGEAPDVSIFYGRTKELATLEEWIIKDKCRLVALLGMPGIGKSFLAHKLAQQIQDEFKIIVWRSLRNAPPLLDLLADLLNSLPHSSESELPKNANEGISRLIGYLRQHRCLVILDSLETILRSRDPVSRYSKGYEDYSILLKRIGEEQHQSCLVISSQQKPGEIIRLESTYRQVRSWQVEGLTLEAAKKILQERGLNGKESWEDLINLYRGNPLILKLVAATIEDIFNKDVVKFIKLGTTVLSPDYRELLDDQFKRLSDLEKEVIQYLATENAAISFDKLHTVSRLTASQLIEVLEYLGRGSLIEKILSKDSDKLLFTLQPVVKKYVQKYR